jgi:hypothetical protein
LVSLITNGVKLPYYDYRLWLIDRRIARMK